MCTTVVLTVEGYSYRMVYVDQRPFLRVLREMTGMAGALPLFSNPIINDQTTSELIADFHAAAERHEGTLALETHLLRVLAHLVARYATKPATQREPAHHAPLASTVHRYLVRHLDGDPSLSDLATVTGVSRYHLLRLFCRQVGMPPHAYLTQLRLREARLLLATGETAARVAAAVGFVDQSHLIKRFRAAYGITPMQFAAGRSGGASRPSS
jgi:AraC-like DNA-binding protein